MFKSTILGMSVTESVFMRQELNAKCVLVGDVTVGKTSLAKVFVSGHFQEHYSASCGGTFMAKSLKDPPVTLQIWDTAGTERFRSMLPHFLRDAKCVLFVFDLSERSTFLSIRDFWVEFVQKNTQDDNLVMVLAGNKVDKDTRQVKESDARGLAEHYGMNYFETSAKTSQNVSTLFFSTAHQILESTPTTTTKAKEESQEKQVVLHLGPPKKKFKCCLTS